MESVWAASVLAKQASTKATQHRTVYAVSKQELLLQGPHLLLNYAYGQNSSQRPT